MTESERVAFLKGQYEMCSLLLTSPVFRGEARRAIEAQGWRLHDLLVESGVPFEEEAA